MGKNGVVRAQLQIEDQMNNKDDNNCPWDYCLVPAAAG
jgi:hypothetical protein